MSSRELRALLLLLGLAVAGHLIRAFHRPVGVAPGELIQVGTKGDPAAQVALVQELMAPLGAGERIDVERASVAQLRRLPGVGPALAARIVADRESRGPFGGLAGLDRVAGVGPATLGRLSAHLQFNGVPADISNHGSNGLVDLNRASLVELATLPGIGPARAGAIVAFRDSSGPFRDITDLKRLPGFSIRLVARLAPLVVIR